ncbi:MAG: hypothetical protein IPJ86_09025 [Bacteroidetes bacterium]|nr:hypothetical protein [Bacteroidota bacterium]
MKGILYLLLIVALSCSSCEKESEIISGNVAPSDPTVSSVQIRQYVQKVYLAIIGTVPSDTDMVNEINFLARNNCSVNDRSNLLDRLFANPLYKTSQYVSKNDLLLEAITSSEINDIIDDIQDDLNSTSTIDTAILNRQLFAMQQLQTAKQDYINGTINLAEVQRRMTASVAFTYANGYGDAWIEAVFGFFLFRLPTLDELDQSGTMLEGFPAYLFLQTGASKEDFIQIFFSSRPFKEGQVRALFREHLYREPNTSELLNYTNSFSNTMDHKLLMRQIFLTNEFLRGE